MRFLRALAHAAFAACLVAAPGANGRARAADPALPYNPDAIPLHQYRAVDRTNALVPSDFAGARERFVTIFGGSTRGTYYYVASAICRVLEAGFETHRIRCVPLRSQGVASNVALMNQGRAQFVIVQSDTNHAAAGGRIEIAGARSVMSLHDEAGLLAVRPDAGIRTPADLRGKRINLGPPGSAAHALWEEFLAAQGISISDLKRVFEVSPDLNEQGLCGDYLDAFGQWIGHPVATFAGAIENCGATVLGMWSEGTAALVARHGYYVRSRVPAGTYAGQDQPLDTYGFKASLIAYAPVDPYLTYWMVRGLVGNIDLLRGRHPTLRGLDPRAMVGEGNFLPFHDGAACAWRELGLLGDRPADGCGAAYATPRDPMAANGTRIDAPGAGPYRRSGMGSGVSVEGGRR